MAQNCANGSTIVMEGVSVVFANQYPNAASIRNLVQSTEGFTGATNTFIKAGAPTANCWVRYNAATIAAGVITPPTLTYDNVVMAPGTEVAINADLHVQC
jgi:hypothetical protein